ncbi:MAG: DUF4145 domain-containing protein [Lacunisphaera sp.]
MILKRFESVIADGADILMTAEFIPAMTGYNELTRSHYEIQAAYKKLNWPRYVEWRTKATTLASHVVPDKNIHNSSVSSLAHLTSTAEHMEWAISFLKAIKNDLESGFFDSLSIQIEAEIASDYMGQAEQLLGEGQTGKFDHVPAAVLAGAVLEKALRKLCGQQQPPVSTLTTSGEPKTLNPLIDDLKKAGLFNELKAKQLRAWADIRNKAAHGDFDQFNRGDVEQMIQGVSNFLADYIK